MTADDVGTRDRLIVDAEPQSPTRHSRRHGPAAVQTEAEDVSRTPTDTRYVVDLVAANVRNTMHEATMHAVADYGQAPADSVRAHDAHSQQVQDRLNALGNSIREVVQALTDAAAAKFDGVWEQPAEPADCTRPDTEQTMTTTQSTGPRIVVGIDGSEPSRLALRWGAFLAAPISATVEAVIAWQVPVTYGWAAAQWDPCTEMTAVLNQSVHAVFGDRPPVPIHAQAREGGAARVLIEASHGAHMLVVGSRGHGGFVGLLLGSVSASVAEHAACPVLVVHGDQGPPGPPREQAVQGARPAGADHTAGSSP
jgi:nucleotide-binding universal stress UspA family protein